MGSLFVGVAVFTVWMVSAGSPAVSEWVAAAIAALIGAAGSEAIRRVLPMSIRAPLRWLKGLPLALAQIPSDTVRVVAVIVRLLVTGRQPRAGFQVLGLPPTPADTTPEAWQAYLTATLSTSPNSVVIGVDPARRTLLAHQLVLRNPATVKQRAERLA